jgi:hypothetical protein
MATGLQLRIEKDGIHGLVEPAAPTSLAEYQQALAGTREQWVVEED